MTQIHPGVPEWTEEGTLLLRIPPSNWPPPAAPVRIDGIEFQPKRELHVTLIGRALGAELRSSMDDARIRNAMDGLDADWGLTRQRRWLRLEKREGGTYAGSIIERVELPAMAALHERLGALLGRALPVPPPHVTLYTAGKANGIGVPDVDALARMSVREVAAVELGLPPSG